MSSGYASYSNYSNYINIYTKSNLTSHKFIYHDLSSSLIDVKKSDGLKTDNYEIKIPLKDFEYENEHIYKDFLELLCAGKYPFITIIITQNQLKKLLTAGNGYSPEIMISMAGNSTSFNIRCKVFDMSKHLIYISGRKVVRLSDFNIKPPIKFGGLVKVRDEVNIDFGFIIRT